ncbi:MAG: ABC transporter permease [Ilumatobacteraceae bacterium]
MNALRIRTVVRRHCYVLWRAPHRWFDIAFWPLMDVILWGSLGTYVATLDGPTSSASASYLLAGIIMFHVLFQSQMAVATGFMEETWSRNLLNVLTTPVTEVEYVAGTALFGFAKVALALTTLSLTALGFFGFHLSSIGWSLVPIGAILVLVGWAVGIAGIGVVLRFGQGAEVITWGSNFILMALSGVFNPVDALPGVLQPVARLLPSTHAFSALRTVLAGQPLPWHEIRDGLLGAVVFVALGFAYATFALRTFRKRGFVTRFS